MFDFILVSANLWFFLNVSIKILTQSIGCQTTNMCYITITNKTNFPGEINEMLTLYRAVLNTIFLISGAVENASNRDLQYILVSVY